MLGGNVFAIVQDEAAELNLLAAMKCSDSVGAT
jgi:hypothetical protein